MYRKYWAICKYFVIEKVNWTMILSETPEGLQMLLMHLIYIVTLGS